MGTWGTGLYDNDMALDVRDTFTEALSSENDLDTACNKTLSVYSGCFGSDEEPLLWLALADTQFDYGCLMDTVRTNAISWIEKEGGKNLFTTRRQQKKWEQVLQQLREKIQSKTVSSKKICKPEVIKQNYWNNGDVFAYQFHTSIAKERNIQGKYVLFQKITSVCLADHQIHSVIQVRNHLYDQLPKAKIVEQTFNSLPILPLVGADIMQLKDIESEKDFGDYFSRFFQAAMTAYGKHSYPQKYFSYICHLEIPPVELHYNQYTELDWSQNSMDEWLSDYLFEWRQ